MKKIGILGGTFDPPHIGHLIIADQVLQKYRLNEIWFMPNHVPPHKIKDSNTTDANRLTMLQLAINNHRSFKIESIELEREGKSYTYDTMVLLKEREKDTQFYFIIGADMVEYLPKWYKIDELVQLVQFIGVNRPFYKRETRYPVQFIDIPSIHISSSMIREKIVKGESVNYLIPDNIIHYIEENGLYGSK
ncbi:nicotinate-nucleotide adenylyltransferase [Caldibacillus lycopersici]|uniref:Probable nicotinate-nucleotide adenylyltransferase n=1 Tax=Perspicuibacillus lycopersici TaxID=1325689 RepID=A0AAE3IW45_9BACI|nr:nicotinate-nucleotide adenylyltransferase [Perspicuibacillus lycopersici]MCU9613949.1 nicotinate-nucleotide adenylyltransferase [Perspicuibacillus lycopersici]